MKIGDEYISKCGQFHLRIVSLITNYENSVGTCCVYKNIPLRDDPNGIICLWNLNQFYIPKTEAVKLLFYKE